MLTVANVLRRAAECFSSRLAVWDGDVRLTYGDLARRVEALAAALHDLGLRRGDRVAILDVNSHRYLEAYYAAAQSGIILVPLNIRLSTNELAGILADCGAGALLYATRFAERAEELRARCPAVGHWIELAGAYEELLAGTAGELPAFEPDPDDVFLLYYTSGTTGRPKGVCLTYRNMTATMFDSVVGLELTRDDVFLHSAPLFHLADACMVWTQPLLGAAAATIHFDPERMLQALQETGATVAVLPPTLLDMLCAHPRLADYDRSRLRLIMFGGAPMPAAVLERATAALGVRFCHAYGITETSGTVSFQPHDGIVAKPGSAGTTAAHIELEILDDGGWPVPSGTVGEVAVRGARVMREYWNNATATAEAIVEGWYHTGDLGYLDAERTLYIVDRKKDMIITGAENVYSVEVENALSTHPDVLEAAVIGVPHEQWGEAVLGIVCARAGSAVTEGDLIAHVRAQIAGYKVPKRIDVAFEPLPKTSTGKLAKAALRARYVTPKAVPV